MSDDTPVAYSPAATRDLPRGVRLLRWPVVVVALLAALAAWATTPLETTGDSLIRDLADGEVARVLLDCASGEPHRSGLQVRLGPVETVSEYPTRRVCWVNDSGLTFTADLTTDLTVRSWSRGLDRGQRPAFDRSVAATVASIDPEVPVGHERLWTGTVERTASWVATVVLVALVIGLLLAPQPRRLTKWGTFWVLLLPGIGPAWWLGRDAPWDRNLQPLPEPAPGWRGYVGGGIQRFGGGTGFGILLLASLLLGATSMFVHDQLLPDAKPVERSVWTVVPAGAGAAQR